MTQFKAPSEQGTGVPLPAYLKVLRLFEAACIALGPLAFLLYAIFDPTNRLGAASIAANAVANPLTNQAHLLFGILATLCLPIGFLGMALLAMRRTPWLGTICLVLAIPAWAPLCAFIALDALTYDMAQMGGGSLFVALWNHFSNDSVMFPYLVIYAAGHLIATVLLGIALGRGRIIPLWASVALILSAPLTIIFFPFATIASRTHLPFLDFLLNLHLVTILLTIGCLPAALSMLKLSNEKRAIRPGEQPTSTNLL